MLGVGKYLEALAMFLHLSVKVLGFLAIISSTLRLFSGGGAVDPEAVDSVTVAAFSSVVSGSVVYVEDSNLVPSHFDISDSGRPNKSSSECRSLPHAVPTKAIFHECKALCLRRNAEISI